MNNHFKNVQKRAKELIKAHKAHKGQYTQKFRGHEFYILPDVFNPKYGEGAGLLVDNLKLKESDHVLEVGTGCGAVAILSGLKAQNVVATDICPEAIDCARRNVAKFEMGKKVEVRFGDLFEPIKSDERFNLIVFNPPFMDAKPTTPLEQAMYDPEYRSLRKFFSEAKNYMTKDGRILIVFSSVGDILRLGCEIMRNGFVATPVDELAENDNYFCVYELTVGSGNPQDCC